MYRILEIKRPNGRTAAIIESSNGNRRVSFAESKHLEIALEKMLAHGLNVIIPRGNEQIEIRTSTKDADFLEEIGRYLQLSFDFLCNYIVTDISSHSMAPIETFFPRMILIHSPGEWPDQQPRILRQFVKNVDSQIMAIQNSPNWVVE